MIIDVDGLPGVQIVITERTIDLLGSAQLIYRGDVLVDGQYARYVDSDSRGYTWTRDLPVRTAPHSVEGLDRLIDVLTRELYSHELAL